MAKNQDLERIISEEARAAVERIRTSATTPTDDEVVERYVHISLIVGRISTLCRKVGANRVADMPDGPDKVLAMTLIDEEAELSRGLPAMPKPELRRRIKERIRALNASG